MEVVIGFMVGYYLGSITQPLDFAEINRAWQEIKKSEEAQAFMQGGAAIARQALRQSMSALLSEGTGRR